MIDQHGMFKIECSPLWEQQPQPHQYSFIPKLCDNGQYVVEIRACVCINNPIVIEPTDYKIIPTGLIFSVPEGYEVRIRPRVGMALTDKIALLNQRPVITHKNKSELKLILANFNAEPYLSLIHI